MARSTQFWVAHADRRPHPRSRAGPSTLAAKPLRAAGLSNSARIRSRAASPTPAFVAAARVWWWAAQTSRLVSRSRALPRASAAPRGPLRSRRSDAPRQSPWRPSSGSSDRRARCWPARSPRRTASRSSPPRTTCLPRQACDAPGPRGWPPANDRGTSAGRRGTTRDTCPPDWPTDRNGCTPPRCDPETGGSARTVRRCAGPTPRGCGSPRRRRSPRRPFPSPPSPSPPTACRARRSRPERAP